LCWRAETDPVDTGEGYYTLSTPDTREVPVRGFLTLRYRLRWKTGVYPQIVIATRFAGVKLVVITPDAIMATGCQWVAPSSPTPTRERSPLARWPPLILGAAC